MSVDNILNQNYVRWMEQDDSGQDIVISSRVRLARNLHEVPFPHLLDEKKGTECLRLIRQAWEKAESPLKDMDFASLHELSALDRQILMEKHLISPEHSNASGEHQGLLVNADGSLCTMINEEDHLRIQCLLPGLKLSECCQQAMAVDDAFEAHLDYAFDERRGYLTACPTNVGTGLRVSLMLHLPAIQFTGQARGIFQNLNQLGLAVRGIYGEGSEALGNFFQVSNQVTLGQTEEDICNYLQGISQQLVEQEKVLRETLRRDMNYQLQDRVGRAYGILTHAHIITSHEALALLSDVRLGVDMGILKGITPFDLNGLIVAIRPAHLQRRTAREMDAMERDVVRAETIKEKLRGIK